MCSILNCGWLGLYNIFHHLYLHKFLNPHVVFSFAGSRNFCFKRSRVLVYFLNSKTTGKIMFDVACPRSFLPSLPPSYSCRLFMTLVFRLVSGGCNMIATAPHSHYIQRQDENGKELVLIVSVFLSSLMCVIYFLDCSLRRLKKGQHSESKIKQ